MVAELPPPQPETPSKPHSISTAAGGIIFISAGMSMALGLGWFQYSLFGSTKHFCYSWFIGVMIGSILTAPLINFMPKKFIMALSTLLILIEGILFTSLPHNYDTLLAGRYFNGIAIGLAIVPYLVNASEIAADTNRGACLAIEQYSVTLGIAIQMIYASNWSFKVTFPINCVHGIIDIVLAVVAGILLVYFIESPIDLLRKGEDEAALECLGRLRLPKGVTTETRTLFVQHRAYVREQQSWSMGQSLRQGLLPLGKMLLFRSMMLAFCYSLPLNAALEFSMIMNSNSWAPTVVACVRILGAVLAVCLVDIVGRKLPSTFAGVIIGGLTVCLGTLFEDYIEILNAKDMTKAMILCIVIQALAGFYSPYTSVYLGEAFPLRVKPYLIVVCVIVEQIVQIVLIETASLYLAKNLITQGIIIVAVFLILCLSMPETRKTSLAKAQGRFRKWFNMKLK